MRQFRQSPFDLPPAGRTALVGFASHSILEFESLTEVGPTSAVAH